MKRRVLIPLVALLVGCAGHAPTPVANVADVATEIEQSANIILQTVQQATTVTVPSTGKTVVTRDQLDQVAIQVNKLGRLGVVLRKSLDDYNTAKASGLKDLTAQATAANNALNDVAAAANVIGTVIPAGTLQQVDQSVAAILNLISTVRGSLTVTGGV